MMNNYRRDPFKHVLAEAYVTAVNILAVEYLIKQYDEKTYTKYINVVYDLSEPDLIDLGSRLSLNMHTDTLGSMITQGDYDDQKRYLIEFLDSKLNTPKLAFIKGNKVRTLIEKTYFLARKIPKNAIGTVIAIFYDEDKFLYVVNFDDLYSVTYNEDQLRLFVK